MRTWQLLSLIVVVLGFGLTTWRGIERLRHPSRAPTRAWIGEVGLDDPQYTRRCGPGDELPVITVLASPEKREWLSFARDSFMRECGKIHIQLLWSTDLEALAQLETGGLQPNLWLPSDRLFIDSLEERWLLGGEHPAIERGPSLLRTPVVLLVWSDRGRALAELWPEASAATSFIAELTCPEVESWSDWADDAYPPPHAPVPALHAQATERWGPIDLRHPSPVRWSPGISVLVAMAHGWLTSRGLQAHDAGAFEHALEQHEEAFEAWLRNCEPRSEGPRIYPRLMTQHMYQRGPDGVDGVFTYEHLAFEVLRAQPDMRLIYPRVMPVADHPAALFVDEKIEVTRRFTNFLGSEDMRTQAVILGLRPSAGSPSPLDMPIPASDNPILAARPFGALLDLDDAVDEPPRLGRDGLRELLECYSRATGIY